MKNLVLGCLLGLLCMAVTCQKGETNRELLLQKTWLHSHEEDQGDILAYRPNSYDFPPSRGRTGFSLNENNAFVQYEIAPTDGLEERVGKWKLMGSDVIKVTFEDSSFLDFEMEILALEANLLKVRRRPQE